MTKTTKNPKPRQNPLANPRSRASKRASSPSIDIDKSLRDAPRASDATPVLAPKPYGGINKAKRKQKALTRGQKKRQERVLARAEVVQDQLAKKADVSQVRLKRIRERKAQWDESTAAAAILKQSVLNENADEIEGDEWEDEEMEESETKVVDSIKLPAFASTTKMVIVDRTTSAHNTYAEDDIDTIT